MLYFYVAAKNAAHRAQKGAGMAEYALLLVLVAAALFAVFTALAGGIGTALNSVTTKLGGTAGVVGG